jgi:hypothetical protein
MRGGGAPEGQRVAAHAARVLTEQRRLDFLPARGETAIM